ncbi:hypothetical protein [Enterovirga rhinocerotis]|uniref:Uncharacterized protein n=1 Tax=Enterovirga rhinocerotis TaxID=1339210 RepID=A0A4R7C7R0_9HYPH|nr:hypothetical protein [Enterovirga rhinocerotis]TDR94213.1 hypothetical protein EV668_1493 [Enterovirga rhinocerotis]
MAAYVYELFYRGSDPASGEPTGTHVILAEDLVDSFGNRTRSTNGPMTLERADTLGYPPSAIFEHINMTALAQIDTLSARASTLESENGDLRLEVEQLTAALAAATPAPTADPDPDPANA